MAEDAEVDIVYIATIHPTHHALTKMALEAGKHVLVEKPFTMNHREAAELVDFAAEKGLFLMEAMSVHFHLLQCAALPTPRPLPVWRRLLVTSGSFIFTRSTAPSPRVVVSLTDAVRPPGGPASCPPPSKRCGLFPRARSANLRALNPASGGR